MKRAHITIEYCVECLYLPRAIDLAQSLLQNYGDQIESLTLVPGHEGVFDVTLNEQKIFVMEGVLPKPDKLVKQISNALAGRDAA
jgi:selenoprotein W-related protein